MVSLESRKGDRTVWHDSDQSRTVTSPESSESGVSHDHDSALDRFPQCESTCWIYLIQSVFVCVRESMVVSRTKFSLNLHFDSIRWCYDWFGCASSYSPRSKSLKCGQLCHYRMVIWNNHDSRCISISFSSIWIISVTTKCDFFFDIFYSLSLSVTTRSISRSTCTNLSLSFLTYMNSILGRND